MIKINVLHYYTYIEEEITKLHPLSEALYSKEQNQCSSYLTHFRPKLVIMENIINKITNKCNEGSVLTEILGKKVR